MHKNDLVQRSDTLDVIVNRSDVSRSIEQLQTSGERLKKLVKYTRIAIGLEFLLVVGFVIVFTLTQVNRSSLESARASVIASCNANNEFRKDNLVLWKYILAVPRDPSRPVQTPTERENVKNFTAYVENVFSPRDCERIYNK